MSIYKACDIRGIYGRDLDEDIAYRLGRALGKRLAGESAVVGGDLRLSTPVLKAALIRGMVETGARVQNIGIVPTPTLYWARILLGATGAVMVTASHNPAQYNGFKFMLHDRPATPEQIEAIAVDVENGVDSISTGSSSTCDITSDYEAFLQSRFGHLQKRRVVVDAGNGSLAEMAPRVLAHVGVQVVPLYCTPDGSFPNRDPNPAQPEHIRELCHRVVSEKAELGVAYDGDGDRVIFCDETGKPCEADRLFVLFIRNMLKQHHGASVVYDQKCSDVVQETIKAEGGVPLVERSGHAFIKQRLIDEQAILGGEISGHYFFGDLQGDDALYATLMLLSILDAAGAKLTDLLATIPEYITTPDIRVPCPQEQAEVILNQIKSSLSGYPQEHIDGIRVDFANGWALARLSVTEPLLTLRFEARSTSTLEVIKSLLVAASPALCTLLEQTGHRL